MLSVADIMEQALRRTIVESDAGDLFGTGPDRAISAYRSFWVPETNPGVIIECPLLGAASYDVLVGPYLGRADPSMHLPSANPPACHAAYDWATRLGISPRVDLFFELDADGPERQHAGIHCKHLGRLELATEFYEVIGEGWRAPQYRSVEERLPEGWCAEFAAVFAGRVGTPTRLEVLLSPEAQRLVGESPEYLRSCFDQMGFVAYSDQMLRDICRLPGSAAFARSSLTSCTIVPWGAPSPSLRALRPWVQALSSSLGMTTALGVSATPMSRWE